LRFTGSFAMFRPMAEEIPGTNQAARADFRHVESWIFDLDNTLYRGDNGIFAQIESRMTDYVMAALRLPREEARIRQKEMYRAYGTTMNGMMMLHGTDPEDYLGFVHDIDLSALPPDPALGAALARLPGRRFVFTNGCRAHAARILDRLGLSHLFDAVWDIRTSGFTPKPAPAAYARAVAAGGIAAEACAMFDDLPGNLVPARAMGMTTVWLDCGAPWSRQGPAAEAAAPPHHVTADLTQFLHSIRTRHDA
jgi:putative hydrolase of the HAD superfamily